MKTRIAAMVVGLLAASAGAVRAQEGAPPEASLGSRVRIRVAPRGGEVGTLVLTGSIIEDDAERIVLRIKGNKPYVIDRSLVRGLEVSGGRRRGLGALIGFGIGFGVGFLVLGPGAYSCRSTEFLGCLDASMRLMYGTVGLGLIGAVNGAIAGPERWHPVDPSRRRGLTIAPMFERGPGVRLVLSF